MKTGRNAKKSLVAILIATSLTMSAPARADRVLCDGNYLCLAVAVPFLLAGAAIGELVKPSGDRAVPSERDAESYVEQGQVRLLQRLLRAKPEVARDPVQGHHLLMRAASTGNLAITRLLVEAGAAPGAGSSSALGAATSTEVSDYLIAHGAVPGEVDLAYVTHHITQPRALDLLETLLEGRASLDPDDSGALAVLKMAAVHSRTDLVDVLLQRGVNPNGGAKSVMLTLAGSCAGTIEVCDTRGVAIARALIARGAKAKVVDDETGRSAQDIARERGYVELARLLDEVGS